jgi:streptogramin lyase
MSWIISTVVGTGQAGHSGDGGPAAQACLDNPFDVAFDRAGNLYLSDTFNHCIRRVDASTGVIDRIAGRGEAGYSGDGGRASEALLNEPYGIVLDADGNLYFADRLNRRVRRVDTRGVITTIAGTGEAVSGGDGGPPIASVSSIWRAARSRHSRAAARRVTTATAGRRRGPASSARARCRWRLTARCTSSNARAAPCAPSIRAPG